MAIFEYLRMYFLMKALLVSFVVFVLSGELKADTKCSDFDAVSSMNVTSMEQVLPCDILVELYLRGLGVWLGFEVVSVPGKLESHGYYLPVRMFLFRINRIQSEDFDNDFGLLLSSIPFLDQLDDEKKGFYLSYILSEYWTAKETQNGISGFWIDKAFKDAIGRAGLKSTQELECFILAGFPDKKIRDIKNTKVYLDCIELKG
ncbi:hypothetical protein [Phaeobacter sp. NW0010-22]|uniref:hypothetical protein n=1 Tax=Phaeobacter sp. NW0010-22 TaxID=3135907 RepID=UPI003104BDB1